MSDCYLTLSGHFIQPYHGENKLRWDHDDFLLY